MVRRNSRANEGASLAVASSSKRFAKLNARDAIASSRGLNPTSSRNDSSSAVTLATLPTRTTPDQDLCC